MTRTLTAAVLVLLGGGVAVAEVPPPSTCILQPDKGVAMKPPPGRLVVCGIDLGSRTVKLNVLSMEPAKDVTLRDERLCKRRLGMGALVFDSTRQAARPLPDDAIVRLVDTVREYGQICERDGGKVVAVSATQWGRDATNIEEVVARVKAETGLAVDVLSREQEAEYSYSAAALNRPGRVVLDSGSNSFELAWQEEGAPGISSITVPYGYVRGAANDFDPAKDYAAGVAAYQARAREMIERDLAQLTPPMSLARLRELVAGGKVGRDLITLGEDGSTVPLVVRRRLRVPSGWVSDGKKYDAVLGGQPRPHHPSFGVMTAPPVTAAEVRAYLRAIRPADFETLKTQPVRGLYGEKALVIPALVELLLRELGATRLVTVPQEVTTGHVLRKLAK